ncbi:Cytochrome b5-like protein, partial [Globisporangium splendens]
MADQDHDGAQERDHKLRYYIPHEVAVHNQAQDCWVSINHRVLDLSELIMDNREHFDCLLVLAIGVLTQPLVLHAGEDISHWFDPETEDYTVGKLTRKARWVEVVNVLTQQRHSLQVCCEEAIHDIQTRYLKMDSHAASYTWKYLDDDEFVPLKMNYTLDENGIPDESSVFERLSMDEHQYKPILHLYFNDDLTIA